MPSFPSCRAPPLGAALAPPFAASPCTRASPTGAQLPLQAAQDLLANLFNRQDASSLPPRVTAALGQLVVSGLSVGSGVDLDMLLGLVLGEHAAGEGSGGGTRTFQCSNGHVCGCYVGLRVERMRVYRPRQPVCPRKREPGCWRLRPAAAPASPSMAPTCCGGFPCLTLPFACICDHSHHRPPALRSPLAAPEGHGWHPQQCAECMGCVATSGFRRGLQ
jgi:hypothetical protein